MLVTVENIRQFIEEADMILVGLGEEFEEKAFLEQNARYREISSSIRERQLDWLLPYVNTYFLKQGNSRLKEAYGRLSELLEEKNFFLVSVAMNGYLREAGFPKERIVEPCGNYYYLQCEEGCVDSLEKTPDSLLYFIERCCTGEGKWEDLEKKVCESCGKNKVFNNIYAKTYLEEGYLQQWEKYTAWIQGLLNKKVCVLELGAGMKYPSVIRWPFEKIAFFQEKAVFIRVHETLYQLTEELAKKAYSLPDNAVKVLENKFQ